MSLKPFSGLIMGDPVGDDYKETTTTVNVVDVANGTTVEMVPQNQRRVALMFTSIAGLLLFMPNIPPFTGVGPANLTAGLTYVNSNPVPFSRKLHGGLVTGAWYVGNFSTQHDAFVVIEVLEK